MPPNLQPTDVWHVNTEQSSSDNSTSSEVWEHCDQVVKLFQSNYFQAEARLAARRQARYEARNIRMRELEKKQKEEDEVNNHGSSMNHGSGSHSLIQHTSSTNSNHNNIHSGKLSPFSHPQYVLF